MARITPAENAIRKAIARDGRITFRRFMEMALYSAPGSYYGSEAEQIGAEGDYFTSPEVHPSFGSLLARQVEQLWVAMDRPVFFALVEMGAGRGSLARDILAYTAQWAPTFHRALRYVIVERSPALARRQQQTLASLGSAADGVTWHRGPTLDLEEGSVEGCLLSNELLDAFPVHRVAVVGGDLKEVYVEDRDGQLVGALGGLSDPRLASYFHELGFLPPEGCRVEVNLEALNWVQQAARVLKRGMVVTLDYGYPAEELYSRRHCEGTLLCFYRHTLNADPYARVGQQDMTTHVDFTSLSRQGAAHGLEPLGLATQRSFLLALGMGGYLETLPRLGLRRRNYEANWVAMQELLNPQGLGRVKALLQQKGLEDFKPAGLHARGLLPGDLQRDFPQEPVPLLTSDHMPLTTTPAVEPLLDEEGMWRELMGEEED